MIFKNYKESFKEESDIRRNIDFPKLCTYGIKPLDDSMLAIARNELIVVAAGSGYGKTEAALHISRHNALNGKKVAHYNLEGGSLEVTQRMKWKDMVSAYFAEYSSLGVDLDYRSWMLNKTQEPIFNNLEAAVYNDLQSKIGENLYLYDSQEGLDCDKFCRSLVDLEGLKCDRMLDRTLRRHFKGLVDLDLIVIDHLHYFSLTKDENEIREITEILKTAKTITEEMNIPIILVAHLRKLLRGHGIPDKEDIYGTSNIHKIANTCIIIAPDHENDDLRNGVYPTFFRVAKSRQGLRPNILINCNFNVHTRCYEDQYTLRKCYPDGTLANGEIPYIECPKWYKGRKIEEIKNERNIYG